MTPKMRAVRVVAAVLVAGACQDLVVVNENQPDRNRALAQPDAVELLVASTYPALYNRLYRDADTYAPLSAAADEATNSDNAGGSRDLSTLPRRPYDNNPVNDDQYDLVEEYWAELYEVFSNATDALRVMDDGLVIETDGEDNTHRLRVIAKLMQGVSLGYHGLLFDQGYVFDEDTPDEVVEDPVGHGLDLVSYDAVLDRAVAFLDEAIQLGESGPDFTVPAGWFYAPADLTRADVIEMAHAYATRFLVIGPRTTQERASVDWQAVLSHATKVTKDVRVTLGASSTGRNNNFISKAHTTSSNSRWYASNLLVGPADTSGAFQAWLAQDPESRTRFQISTPDRRITGASGPTANGRYFRYVTTDLTNPVYGSYRQSYYQWARYHSAPINNNATSGSFAVLPLTEVRLYAAEAYLRTDAAAQAVTILNQTRVANGSLPPVTTDGVPAAGCVPRTRTGACGTLLDALVYERMVELAFVDAVRTWADKRGFGALTTGTVLHIPIPYAQQLILGMPYYTFGGSGPGSAQ